MRGERIAAFCALAYVLLGLFTFGHAASHMTTWHRCCELPPRAAQNDEKVVTGLFWGVLWPLYWSWELQE